MAAVKYNIFIGTEGSEFQLIDSQTICAKQHTPGHAIDTEKILDMLRSIPGVAGVGITLDNGDNIVVKKALFQP